MMNDAPLFRYWPKEWGIYIPYGGKERKLVTNDIKKLEWLREELEHKHGELVTYKEDIQPITDLPFRFVLSRLWANGIIFKFAKQMHTQSGRPEYIRWWIWEDYERTSGSIGSDPSTPVYISAG